MGCAAQSWTLLQATDCLLKPLSPVPLSSCFRRPWSFFPDAGNLTGDFCLLADLGSKSLTASLGDAAPWILVSNHGRGIMLLLVLGVIFPLRSASLNKLSRTFMLPPCIADKPCIRPEKPALAMHMFRVRVLARSHTQLQLSDSPSDSIFIDDRVPSCDPSQ